MNPRRVIKAIVWYIREAAGENDYDRYVAHTRRHDPDAPILSRRDFERLKTDEQEANPRTRCC